MKKTVFILGGVFLLLLSGFIIKSIFTKTHSVKDVRVPSMTSEKMLIVLSAPSVHNDYYAEVHQQIVDFQVNYANAILAAGQDDVAIIVDKETRGFYEGRTDANLLDGEVEDIWMRDFTTVNPSNPVQFVFGSLHFEGQYALAESFQASFNRFLDQYNFTPRYSDLILDGGNLVDDYNGRIIVTERFLEDNELTESEAIETLKRDYGANKVAIIPYDDEIMGHADGMVMFVDDVLFINEFDEPLRTQVREKLTATFPEIEIVEVEADYDIQEWKDYSSACGININSTVTNNAVYVPIFGNTPQDKAFLKTLEQYTDKTIVPVDAQGVCFMGGSVRCLSWQVKGENRELFVQK